MRWHLFPVVFLDPSVIAIDNDGDDGQLRASPMHCCFLFLLFLVLISFFESGVVLQNFPQVITAHWTCAEYPTLVENEMTRILYHPHRLRSSDNKGGIINNQEKENKKKKKTPIHAFP